MTHNLFVGNLLILSAPEPADIPIVSGWTGDSEFLRRLQLSHVRPLNQTDAEASYLGGSSGTNHLHFRLRTRPERRLVGYVALYDIYWNLQIANLGIAIGDPADHGKGYGRDGLELILHYAFDELNLYRIGLTVLERNTAARALYARTGFVHEGTLRANDYRDGVRGNDIQMSMLAPEYRVRITQDSYFSS
jgi:RimJ/RimL family protein N-acetyltransferase